MKYNNENYPFSPLWKLNIKICSIFIMVLFFSSCSKKITAGYPGNGNKIIQLTNWQYSYSDTDTLHLRDSHLKTIPSSVKWKPVISPNKIHLLKNKKIIWLKTTLPAWRGTIPAIYFHPVFFNYQVFLNKELIFQKGNMGSPEKKYVWYDENLIQFPSYKKGDVLIFRIHVVNELHSLPQKIYLDNSLKFITTVFKKNFINILLVAIFFLISFISISIYIFLERSKLFLGLFLYLFPTGALLAVNTQFFRLVFPHPVLFYHVNYISYHLFRVGFYYLIAQVVAAKYKGIINFLWKFRLALLLIFILIFNFTQVIFFDTLKYIMIVNTVSYLIILIILLSSLEKHRRQQNAFIFGAISVILGSIGEIVMIYAGVQNSDIGYSLMVFQYGALIFVVTVIWLAYDNYMETKREKESNHRKELEAEKRENEVRRNFTSRLLESQETERKRIALELHDSVGQKLLLIRNYMLSNIKNCKTEVDRNPLIEVSELADDTIQEVRNITNNLRPQYLDQLGLTTAVETMCEKISESSGINVSLDIGEGMDEVLPKNDEINFFRIIQEGLNNIVKHSGAHEAYLNIKKENSHVILKIVDDGRGFRVSEINGGTGIKGIRERATILDADLNIVSDENGTTLKLEYTIK